MSVRNFDRDLNFHNLTELDGSNIPTLGTLPAFTGAPVVLTDGTVNDTLGLNKRNDRSLVAFPSTCIGGMGVNMRKPDDGDRVVYRLQGHVMHSINGLNLFLACGIINAALSTGAAGQALSFLNIISSLDVGKFDHTVAVNWHDALGATDVSNRQLTFAVLFGNNTGGVVNSYFVYSLSCQALDTRPPAYISEMR